MKQEDKKETWCYNVLFKVYLFVHAYECVLGLGEIDLVDLDFKIKIFWHLRCQNKKTEATFQCQHPPKTTDYLFVLCINHFWVGFKPIFRNCPFLIVFFSSFYC